MTSFQDRSRHFNRKSRTQRWLAWTTH